VSPIPLRRHDSYELFPDLFEPSEQCNRPKPPRKEDGTAHRPVQGKGSVRPEKRPRLQVVSAEAQNGSGIRTSAEIASPRQDDSDGYLMDARQVAARLGVSERFIRDHTLRRSPRLCAVKLGKLLRYRRSDVDIFMAQLTTFPLSRLPRSRA